MKRFFVLLPFILIYTTGFIRDMPVNIEKIDLKLSENDIAITFFSLSSGEATLIQHGHGGNVLINTGGPGTKRELKELLKTYGVSTLRTIIITKNQPEYNHNLSWLVKTYHVKKLITDHYDNDGTQHLDNLTITAWKKGEISEILPNVFAHVLHESSGISDKNGMDLSLKYENHHILYMSTADKKIERELSKENLSDVNILKVADFASEGGTSKFFLDSVDPQVAVIFQRKGKTPSQGVIERLHDTWIDIYQTSQFGNISIKLSPTNYEVIPISLEFKE